jgi:hypothetical protein
MAKKMLGAVGVDTGQIVICDPCYIDSEWMKEEYDNTRLIEVPDGAGTKVINFSNYLARGLSYESPLEEFGNRSMNDLLRTSVARSIELPQTGRFSYDGCCKATNSPDQGGQLNYRLGHAGVAVAARTGWGDGSYAVYAHYNKQGRVRKIEILFE